MHSTPTDNFRALRSVGLSLDEVSEWISSIPTTCGDWLTDQASFLSFWHRTHLLLAALPVKSHRTEVESNAVQSLLDAARQSRELFLSAHVRAVYDRLTANRSNLLRVEEIVAEAANIFPGLTPSAPTLKQENSYPQSLKDGHEIDQGLLLSHILADQHCGLHLCHAMLLPHPKTKLYQEEFRKTGKVDLGTVYVERVGVSSTMHLRNPKFLNAEDETTLDALEIAVDLCTLDRGTEIAVMRGAPMDQGKYKDKRVFCAGINLTHLYHGKISYLWYLKREMGLVNKIFRGIAVPDQSPDEILGHTQEKLWIAAIDAFAIGGGCQYLLVMDVNIAGSDAYMTLPARKEGIVPGAANLRLPRFVGDRIARQAILMERRIDCDSPEGRMICDQVVAPSHVSASVAEAIQNITRSGVVSSSSNRKAFRVAHEPLDLFRRYMAVYAREQAYCHFSPALILNLEKFWDAQSRKA